MLPRKLTIKTASIDFASNDYLGLAKSAELKRAIIQECDSLEQVGSTGSRLLTGNSLYAESLEKDIASFHQSESGLLFSSGYLANCALISSIAKRDDTILFDKEVHASIRDGITLSHAKHFSFNHNDLCHLENLLKKTKKRAFVCVESLYSVDGSLAPLKELSLLCENFGAFLIVDEAHSTGIFNFNYKAFAKVVTFGKALGVQGAIVLGNKNLKEFLINFARPFIYTTAPSFLHLASIKCAYQILRKSYVEKSRLFSLMNYFKTSSPIVSLAVENGKYLEQKLLLEGIDVSLLRYPTVKKGEEKLRITLHSFNTENEIDHLKRVLCDQL